jgi:murein tripeptide amidase MpaA
MVKRLFLFLILCGIASAFSAQEVGFYRIEISSETTLLQTISQAGISVDYVGADGKAVLEVSAGERKLLDNLGINYNMLIDNLSEYYTNRNKEVHPAAVTRHFRDSKNYSVPQHFALGSMGGFCTYDEMLAHLDTMHTLYPELISAREALPGVTIEGQQVFWLRISDNPDVDEPEPEVFYNSLIHAREPVSMQQMLYYMFFLLENYYSDVAIKRLVDNTEMYFVPCINPDGYLHNQSTNPNGGGMWRKNRRLVNNQPVGVDINRNFDYKWGYDNYGSSAVPGSSIYRGESAFSEPESQMIHDFALQHQFTIVLNCHAYGDYLLHPFGYSNSTTPDDYDLLRHTADRLTGWSSFTIGATSRLLYLVNGDATDWFYADTSKPMAITYTTEIGNSLDGFWPPMARIIPLCEQMLQVNLQAAWLAGSYVEARDFSPVNLVEMNGYLHIALSRSGLEDAPATLSIEPLDEAFISVGAAKVVTSLPLHEQATDSIAYLLKPGLSGQKIQYVITIQNERFVSRDTITKYRGSAETFLYDDCTDTSHWTSNTWVGDTLHAHSAPASIVSNSGSYYPVNQEALIVLGDDVPVGGIDALWVRFFAKWDLDGGRDYVRFVVSHDGGSTWAPLAGRYTSPAWIDYRQVPVFMYKCDEWVEEWVPVPIKDTVPLQFGFLLTSDHKFSKAGFWFDDFRIETLRNIAHQQLINIPKGWSGISSYLYSGAPELSIFFGELLDKVLFLKDEQGFYQPGNSSSTLSVWNSDNGYLIKAAAPFVLEVSGQTKKSSTFLLPQGWSLMPVFSDTAIAVTTLTSEPAASIVIIKEAAGIQVYWPANGIETLHALQPGKSYFIFLQNEATISY